MKPTTTLAALLGLTSGGLAAKATCNADNCARAVTGTYQGLQATRLADCKAVMACTVTPAPSTVTSTVTVTPSLAFTTVTVRGEKKKRDSPCKRVVTGSADTTTTAAAVTAVTSCPTAVPTYASACSGLARYASACSCAGVTQAQVTATASTTTVTTTTTLPAKISTVPVTCLTSTETLTITALSSYIVEPVVVVETSTLTAAANVITQTAVDTQIVSMTSVVLVTAAPLTVTRTAVPTINCFSSPGSQNAVPLPTALTKRAANDSALYCSTVTTFTTTTVLIQPEPSTTTITEVTTVVPTLLTTIPATALVTQVTTVTTTVTPPAVTVTTNLPAIVSPTGVPYYYWGGLNYGNANNFYANLQSVILTRRGNRQYQATGKIGNINSLRTNSANNLALPGAGTVAGPGSGTLFQGYLWPALGQGTYTISSRSGVLDDVGFVWLGGAALGSNWAYDNPNYRVTYPGGPFPSSGSASINLSANEAFPFTIFWGDADGPGAADFVITYNGRTYQDTTPFLVSDCGSSNFIP